MKKTLLLTLLSAFLILFLSSCSNDSEDIVKSYPTAEEAASACGIETVSFVPEGYKAVSYNTVYGFVFETEYKANEIANTDDEMAGIAVLRIADADYKVSNLSGFALAGSADVYTYEDEREFEIKTREGVYMTEWTQNIGDKTCNISYTVFGNGSTDPKDALFNYKMMLEELLEYLG